MMPCVFLFLFIVAVSAHIANARLGEEAIEKGHCPQ